MLLICSVAYVVINAQPYCEVRTFTVRDGLAANTISGFAQTRDGLMWFATWNGLCLYDGNRFSTFRNVPGKEVLSTNRIKVCKPSATGNLWCVTPDDHVFLFDTRKCQFVDVSSMIDKCYGQNVPIRGVYPLSNGFTWIVSNDKVKCIRVDDRHVGDDDYVMKPLDQRSLSMGKAKIRKAELDGNGREWLFASDGILQYGSNVKINGDFEFMSFVGGKTFLASVDGKLYSIAKSGGKPFQVVLPGGVRRINSMLTLGDELILATNMGVVVCDGGRKKLVSVQNPSQPSTEATDLFVDSKKRLWVFTKGDGVVLIDGRTWQTTWLMSDADNMLERTTSTVNFFHEDKNGTIWVVPRGGTYSYFCESDRSLAPYRLTTPGHQDESIPVINKRFSDMDGNLWFTANATDRDISLINFGYYHFRFLPVLQNQDARSVLVDRQGRTWVGMYHGEIALFDRSNRLLGYASPHGGLSSTPQPFATKIYALYEDRDGYVWIGTKGMGLYVISPDGTVRNYQTHASDRYSLTCNDVYDIDMDGRGHVWIATYGGGLNLAEKHEDGLRFYGHRQMKQYSMQHYYRVRRVTHTNKGEIIVSTTGGLLTFSDKFETPEKIHFYENIHRQGDDGGLFGSDVLQALVMRNGHVVVVTLGGGVQRVDQDNLLSDHLKFQNLDDGTVNGSGMVMSVVEDNEGDLWGVCGSNLLRYRDGGTETVQYLPNTTVGYVELSEAKPAHDPKTDRIVLGCRGGVVFFSPKSLQRSKSVPKIVFTSVQYPGRQDSQPVLGLDVLNVSSDNRNFTVYFSALEYGDRFLVKYAYKIEDIDKEWNYIGANNSVSFNNIPAGNHRLLVKSTNGDGVWVNNVAMLNIYAHPTFWETGWAWLFYFLVFCLIVYVVAYIYTLRAKNVMAKEMGDMKMKFFTEIGHKLRTPLTLIGGPVTEVLGSGDLKGQAKKHLEMVQRNASQMLDLVNKMLRYDGGDDTYISDDKVPDEVVKSEPKVKTETDERQLRLLVVEDNDDLRNFLVSILSDDYAVLQATNGRQGLEMAANDMPDFIITDVMMPEMDGLTMVRQIKRNKNICHIPIVVLSAKASLCDRISGLKEGVDDYITKPFSALYLKSRVVNIIDSRKALQQTYIEQINPDDTKTYKLESPQIVDADNEMMTRLLGYLEDHISDQTLKMEDCAVAVGLGRSTFYSKLKSIVGMSPVDFVHHIRMQRAEELVAKSSLTFSEIAYAVGFSDPKYFSRIFKKDMGMPPSEYREKAKKKEK